MTTQQAIKALHERGYSKRKIARELGIHRRTVSNYLGGRGDREDSKCTIPTTGSEELADGLEGSKCTISTAGTEGCGRRSECEAYREIIETKLDGGLKATRIWQDLVDDHDCVHSLFMGIDFDGAFADHVVVPECQVRLIPSDLSFDLAVYAEPVAATRAVLQPLQGVDEPILIYGTGRIARLTEYILTTAGHGDVTASTGPGDQRFGCIIEAADSGTKITDAVGALSPGGRLILKSRHPENLSLPLLPAIKNRIKVEAVYYSQFDEALHFLGEHREFISSLLGNSWPLESCREAFAEASASEGLKTIFAIAD